MPLPFRATIPYIWKLSQKRRDNCACFLLRYLSWRALELYRTNTGVNDKRTWKPAAIRKVSQDTSCDLSFPTTAVLPCAGGGHEWTLITRRVSCADQHEGFIVPERFIANQGVWAHPWKRLCITPARRANSCVVISIFLREKHFSCWNFNIG